jgi:8-oxo-dGTP diphosphatase
VGSAPLVTAGASAVVLDGDGRLLLMRRSDFGWWGLPAGSLSAGETVAQTAVRETHEETGLIVEPYRLLRVSSGRETVYPNGNRLWPVSHMFACRVTGGQLKPDGVEALEAGFFAAGQLPPLSPFQVQLIPSLIEQASQGEKR